MKNKYEVYIDLDGGWEGRPYIDLYNDETKKTVKNKEEWKEAMRTDYILDVFWNLYVEKCNKDGE